MVQNGYSRKRRERRSAAGFAEEQQHGLVHASDSEIRPSGTNGSPIGPLIVCPTNKNYIATPDGKAVYMAGSHAWMDSQNINSTSLRFSEFLKWVVSYESGNWIRFWAVNGSNRWAAGYTINDAQMPYVRTGPGNAIDGKPKWDLLTFNQPQWDEWRADIQLAAQQNPPVYVQWQMWPQGSGFMNAKQAVYPRGNNINGVNIRWGNFRPLFQQTSGSAWTVMTAYAAKVCDICRDLPNVVFDPWNEVSGDGATFNWGVALINYMRQYERSRDYLLHPFILSSSNGSNGAFNGGTQLWSGPSDFVVPGWGDGTTSMLFGNGSRTGYNTGHPPGKKPGIIDSDHTTLNNASPDQVFTTFTRGWGGFLYMDVLDHTSINSLVDPPFGNSYSQADFPMDPASVANRDYTRRSIWAARQASLLVDMTHMIPNDRTSSTGRCLAATDCTEFIVYQNNLGNQFTIDLPAGFTWSVQWVNANTKTITTSEISSSVPLVPPSGDYQLCVIKQNRQ